MKKIAFLCLVVFAFSSAPMLRANDIGEKVLLYIPNRFADLFDIFSVGVGIGPTIRAELMATEAIQVGGGYDFGSLRIYKDWNRQYGLGMQKGYYWSLICAGQEDMTRYNTIGWVKEYYESFEGVPSPEQPIYNFYEGKRDFWRIGGALGFLVEAEVYLNPVEWVDLALGFIMIDVRQDDFELSDF